MPEISVIICTHNPREDYLRCVLEALREQTLPMKDWELLLVDNLSEKPVADRLDLSWHPAGRHVREETVGLTYARLRGIVEAQADILVFVDDDNVLNRDYLAAALAIGEEYPWLGAWGGSYLPEFEVEPSAELRPWLCGLPLETVKTIVWAKLRRGTEACPAGAGLVMRRKQCLHYRELVMHDPVRRALGRSGNLLGGGEDSDMALCGFDLGLGTGKFPQLELIHLIPKQRLNLKYIENIYEGFGYASVILDVVHQPNQPMKKCSFGAVRILLADIFLRLSGKNRTDRRITLAMKKGRLRACLALKQLGYPNLAQPSE